MNKHALAASCALLAFLLSSACADVVTDWNNHALQAIRVGRTAPPRSARALAMLHIAIYDSVNAIDRRHESYLFADRNSQRLMDNAVATIERSERRPQHLNRVRAQAA